MSNGINMEWSQDDRVPMDVVLGDTPIHVGLIGSSTRVQLDTGATLSFFGVPMVDPALVIGEEDAEITIALAVQLNMRFDNTGVNVFLFEMTLIADRLWHISNVDVAPGDGSSCPRFSRFVIRMNAREFFNARQTQVDNVPGWNPETVYFRIAPVGPALVMCGSPPDYVGSTAQINLSFDYLTFHDEELGLKMWDEDLCQNMVMVPTFREGESFPHLLATHSTRVMAGAPSAIDEVCRHHQGEVVIDKDGFARGFYCGRSFATAGPEHQRNYYSDAYIVQEKDDVLSGQVPKGMACFLGSYHAPKWTEAQLWSHRNLCNRIV